MSKVLLIGLLFIAGCDCKPKRKCEEWKTTSQLQYNIIFKRYVPTQTTHCVKYSDIQTKEMDNK